MMGIGIESGRLTSAVEAKEPKYLIILDAVRQILYRYCTTIPWDRFEQLGDD